MDFVLYICYFKSMGELRGKSCGYHLTLNSFAVVFKKTVAFKGFNFDFFFLVNCLISTEALRGHGQKKIKFSGARQKLTRDTLYFSWARETLSGRVR